MSPAVASTGQFARAAAVDLVGIALFAGLVVGLATMSYRRYSTAPLPVGAGAIVGVGVVGAWLNVDRVGGGSAAAQLPLVANEAKAYVVGAVLLGAVAAELGRRLGDHVARSAFDVVRVEAGGEVGTLLRSASLVVPVELPDRVHDAAGYPPVDERTREALAGRTFSLPHRTSRADLPDRIAERIERDFAVGHAAVELSEAGDVERLAVGGPVGGLAPAIPPASVAVTVPTDGATDASRGDPVEVWSVADGDGRLVATGTYHASAGDVATVLVDEADAEAFEAGQTYSLSVPRKPPTHAGTLVSTLHDADEAVARRDVGCDGPLEGEFVEWVPGTVLLLRRDGEVVAFPDARETIQAGDVVYVLGRPDQLRDLPDGGAADDDAPAALEPAAEPT